MHRDISRKKMIRNAVIDEVLETIDEEIEKRNNILGLSIVYDKVKAMKGYGDADPDARLWEGEYEE